MDGTDGTRGAGVGFCGFSWSTNFAICLFEIGKNRKGAKRDIFFLIYIRVKRPEI